MKYRSYIETPWQEIKSGDCTVCYFSMCLIIHPNCSPTMTLDD